MASEDKQVVASAWIYGAEGKISGTVVFRQSVKGGSTSIEIDVKGLSPGEHALFINQFGDISSGAASTGHHFNPFGNQHGSPADDNRHAGDLGNVVSDDQGIVKLSLVDSVVQLIGPNSVIGRAVVFGEKADDSKNEESSGQGVAAGVIGIAAM